MLNPVGFDGGNTSAFTDTLETPTVNLLNKDNHIVCASLAMNGVTASAGDTIAKVPTGYIPLDSIYFYDMNGNKMNINSNGQLRAIANISNSNIRLSGSWYVA